MDADLPLIREFKNQGHDVHYYIILQPFSLRSNLCNIKRQLPVDGIIRADRYEELAVFKDYLDMDNIHVINITRKKAFAPSTLATCIEALNHIRKLEPDIFHCDILFDSFECLFYALRKKMVLTVHDPFPHTGEGNRRKSFFRKIAVKLCRKVVLLNRNQKNEFIAAYDLPADKVSTNRLGSYTATDIFKPQGTAENSSPNVLFFGRISPYKGIEYLLDAMAKVREAIPEASVTVAGGGRFYFDTAPYEALPYVDLRNRYIDMPELATLLHRCDVVVCPYTDATQSGVIMTAYAAGVPVIASDVGGLGEMVEHGQTGLLVPPRDTGKLAEAIARLLGDRELLASLGRNIAEKYGKGENGWAQIARNYIELYQSIK